MYDDEQTSTDLSGFELFRIYQGRVQNNVVTGTDDLFVVIPQMDGEDPKGIHKHGPCRGWTAHPGSVYPSIGDLAAVFVDDLGDYWLAAWEPA